MKPNEIIREWEDRIENEEKIRKEYRTRVKQIEKIYSAESQIYDRNTGQNQPDIDYNIFWVNCQILLSALYSRNPRPDIRRRYKESNHQYNEIGKEIAVLLERALTYTQDIQDYFGNASNSVLSFVKFGAGQMRIKYIPSMSKGMPKKITLMKGDNGYIREDNGEGISVEQFDAVGMGDDGQYFIEEEVEEVLEYEEIQPEYVPISRFHWEPVTNWKDCSWCVIDHFLTKEELIAQFGEKQADKISLGYTENGERAENNRELTPTRALVRECFDKRNLRVQIYAQGCDYLLSDEDDPYELADFYPFPKPMLGTMGNDGLSPVPDYIYYQAQHAELNTITQRINKLLKVVKHRGIYDGSFENLVDVQALEDGEFRAVAEFANMAAASGGRVNLNDYIAALPIADAMTLLGQMYMYRDQVVKIIYEITGISDIVRGSTMASETLGAQELKSQYANLRLQTRQKEVERFFRDVFRIEAEFLAEKFDSDSLSAITGMQITPEMVEVLSSDLLRSYIVDVETDSTTIIDSSREQRERVEAMTAMTNMVQQLAPMASLGLPMPLISEMLLFGLRGFKGARELEDMIQNIGEMAAMPQAAPMPEIPVEQMPPEGMPI